MTEQIIRCDHCGKDLGPDAFYPKYRVALAATYVPPNGPTCAAVHLTPPVPRPCDFCDLACLRVYLGTKGKG